MPEVHELATVSSVLDEVRCEPWASQLHAFDSIIARQQTAGRGQFRRSWSSPEGNIYAALRLPMEGPFLGTEAAVALGVLLALALRQEGYPCLLKWPNDLVLMTEQGEPRKVGGILLEERAGVLVAGIGINVVHAPAGVELRSDAALPATALCECKAAQIVKKCAASMLWKTLVNHVFSFYSHNQSPSAWHPLAQELLLWRNCSIVLTDGEERHEGILRGTGFKGELLLEAQGRSWSFYSGSIRPAC